MVLQLLLLLLMLLWLLRWGGGVGGGYRGGVAADGLFVSRGARVVRGDGAGEGVFGGDAGLLKQ